MTAPVMRWAPHPNTGHWHAISPWDLGRSEMLGHAEALCSMQLPHEGLDHRVLPGDAACLPCTPAVPAWVPAARSRLTR